MALTSKVVAGTMLRSREYKDRGREVMVTHVVAKKHLLSGSTKLYAYYFGGKAVKKLIPICIDHIHDENTGYHRGWEVIGTSAA